MTASIALAVTAGVLVGCGVVLLMARGIVRAFLGFILLGNGVNLLFMVASGPAGRAPISGQGAIEAEMADPLPQALVLTAIVIVLAMTGFAMALAYRSARVSEAPVASDVVVNDPEDERLSERAASGESDDSESTPEDEAVPDTDDKPHEPAPPMAQDGPTSEERT